jgi:Cu(I)/Ag(I) efflux system membrane fusion protein
MKTSHTLLACLTAILTACKESPAPQSQARANAPEPEKEVPIKPSLVVPDTFKAALGKVFEGYSQIQAALAQDDLPKAKEAFSSMHAVLHMMPLEGLDSMAKAEWDSTDSRIMAILHPMASADSIEAAREHFGDFSLVLSEAIGKFGIAGGEPIYQFHCPMARQNQGAEWLQKDSVLANPYFGSSMLKCGERIRTLKG